VPYLDPRAQYRILRSEVLTALEEICESGRFAQGPATSDFETKFAAYCGVDHCVSVNGGASALHLALICLDVGPGDDVITVAMTSIATLAALSDVDIETGVHYPVPAHLQKAYAHLGYRAADLPVTEKLCDQCLSLPIYPELSKEKIFTVASILLNLER
jgi:dTDP-4-amino-4,6-dideoxygalactose transaminase